MTSCTTYLVSMLSIVMLSVIVLNVVMQSVIMLNVVMLSVVEPLIQYLPTCPLSPLT